MADPIVPAPGPAPAAPHEPFGGRFLVRLIGPGGAIGLIGLGLLLAAIVYTCYLVVETRPVGGCVIRPQRDWAPPPKGDEDKFRIVDVAPVAFQFRKQVCVVVENAVPRAEFAKLSDDVKTAERAVAQVPKGAPPSPDAVAKLEQARSALAAFQKGAVYKLYINGQPSTLTAHVEATPEPQALAFTVQPEEDASSANASYWRNVLAGPSHGGRVPIEIGLAPESALAPTTTSSKITYVDPSAKTMIEKDIVFLLYTPIVMWMALAGMACVLIGLGGLAHRTPLLREGKSNLTAYSLSRVQMAFWLVLTTTGFLYVWLVTGEYMNVFPAALFVLIGISGVTAGAAQLMDGPSDTAPVSRGFLHDIAGDWVNGQPQLHRIQIIAWTVILGLIFCWNIIAKLQLTSFDTNLLILAGVANGVYITMKPREND
jgi:hypothetical protein